MRTLERVRRLTWAQRWLVVEAAAGLVSALLQVRLVPFWRVAAWHGWESGNATPSALDDEQLAVARDVGRLVSAVGRRTPWKSTCLMQSLTVATLLRRRGLGSVTHLGLAPKEDGYDAHSWTVAGERILVGAAGHRRFTVVASYRVSPA